MAEESKSERPVFLDAVGKLCKEGLDIAAYLYQVPDDKAQWQKLGQIVEAILKDPAAAKRNEVPRIATELRETLAQPQSMQGVELVQAGFDRMARSWQAAKSGLF
jgi:hypothetical protein